VIDHGRVVENLGLPQSDFGWTLDAKRNVNQEALRAHSSKSTTEQPRTCPECAALWLISEQGRSCPSCGWLPAPKPKPVAVEQAELQELDYENQQLSPHSPQVVQFFREACAWYGLRWPERWRERPKSGRWWAWSQTREKFGFDAQARIPSGFWDEPPSPTSAATAGWLKSQLIRWAKRRAA
jgi:hypothetical protein